MTTSISELARREEGATASNFDRLLQEHISAHLMAGNREPKFLYLGYAEREALSSLTAQYLTIKITDETLKGKSLYRGLQIVRVSEPSFMQVG